MSTLEHAATTVRANTSPPFRLWRRRVWCALIVLLLAGCEPSRQPEPSKPAVRDANLLLITLDTTRADHLSCYSAQGAKTPHLDALAAHGVRFTDATAQVPLTLPSHACIMTGAYPTVHGLRDMGGFVLAKRHRTIASTAQSAGFATAAFVGSRVLARHFGLANGFGVYDDDMGVQTEEGKLPGVFPERRAAVVTDRALDWLRENGKRHFFLWVHYYDPHAPYDPPEPYHRAYAKDLYSGEIAYVDEQVGRLLEALDRQGLTSRTLVAVIGDHGESMGDHGEMTHGIFLYESTTHVPLIMTGPSVPPGKVVDDQVRSIDVMPTVLGFLGLSAGNEAQGVSLWPLIQQGRKVQSNYAYIETLYPRTYMGWSELRAMRTDRWKLIVAPHPELYDLQHDPQETKNVIVRYPADARELRNKIWDIAGQPNQHEKIVPSAVGSETRRELEALGYVSAGTPRQIQLGTQAPDPKDRIEVLKILNQAETSLNHGNAAPAASLILQVLERDPADPMVHLYLATAYEKLGKYESAIHVYQHALDQKIGTDLIYSRLGKDYLRLHQLTKAVTALAHASELDPADLDSLRNLGTAYLQLRRVDDAEKAFKAIVVQNDHYAAAYNGLGLVAIQRGDAETARANFQKAVDVGPDEAEPLLNLGVLYQKTGQDRQAIVYLQKFLAKAPPSEYGHLFPEVQEAIRECQSKQ